MSNDLYSLDIETGPFDPTKKTITNAWALEPYRKEFYVKMIGVAGPNEYGKVMSNDGTNYKNDLVTEIEFLQGKRVYCHNAIFDISCLIKVHGYDGLNRIRWRDTSLLAKWLNNSQKDEKFTYSLRNCVERWLPNSPEKDEFLEMKDNMEDDIDYWIKRVIQDCHLTRDLAIRLESLLPEEQLNGYEIECACLLPLARGYMQGVLIDYDEVENSRVVYQAGINSALRELKLSESIIRSPTKLAKLLFSYWGLTPRSLTPSGNPCTAAGDLKYIALDTGDKRLTDLLAAKAKLTVMSKYINGFFKTLEYLKSDKMHPTPRLFNSYTGRMSYSSKMKKKFQVGIAIHQLPRKDKCIKRAMIAPKGYKFLYMDFAAQELRLMAHYSNDPTMLNAFNTGKDLHSTMTEDIYGIPYDEIVKGNNEGDPEIIDSRNCGKLTNLSSMYRIGAKSLQTKFFEQYDKVITIREATHYLNSYKRTFKRIPEYWIKAVSSARTNRYSESLAGRRFGITNMDWTGESSAINQPIQGSGADLAELAIASIAREFPDMIFQLAVHDSLTWLIPECDDHLEVKEFANNIDYSKEYKKVIKLKFPFDYAIGYNLAELKPF